MNQTMETPAPDRAANGDERSEAGPPSRRAGGGVRRRLVTFAEAYALLILLGAIALFFCFWPQTSDTFPTLANVRILLASQTVIGVISLGALLPLLCNEFDLSVGNVAALSAVFAAAFLSNGGGVFLTFGLAVLVGAVIGGVNALIVTKGHVSGVITTLGMSTILAGVILQKTGGLAPASNIPDSLTSFGTGLVVGVPVIFLALLVVGAVVYFVLSHTTFGRQMYAIGSNVEAAKLVGLRTERIRGIAFVAGSVLCSLGGLLYVARSGGASPNVGATFTLPALAAAFLSAAAVRPGRFNVWGTVIAIFFLAVLNNGLNLAGVRPYVNDYVNGGALIVGVAMAAVLYRRRTT